MDGSFGTSKVAIPKLKRHDSNRRPSIERSSHPRISKACDSCRIRKIRCSGERPRCRNCLDQPSPCTYPLARQDRLKNATKQVDQLVALLKDLSHHVDSAGQHKIDGLLVSLGENAPSPSVAFGAVGEEPATKPTSIREGYDANTEADVSGSVGSNDDLDLVDEDLLRNRESRAIGFVGQNSEVQWFRSLRAKVEFPEFAGSTAKLPHGFPGSNNDNTAHQVKTSQAWQRSRTLHVSDSTYYLDSEDIEMDVIVDQYELPSPEVAEALFDRYVRTVGPSFPVLPDTFEAQFRKYIESVKQGRPLQVPESWQATLNLILAIGAQHSHLAQAAWQADERDHFVYMTRAVRILRLDAMATNVCAPSLPLIQATGLLSIYYLTIGRVSRAWMMIGISLRFALAAGLHLRNGDPLALPTKKESLARTWWSLHSIENLLCTLIGRPCVIPNDQCTVPLPGESSRKSSIDWARTYAGNPDYQYGEDSPPVTNTPSDSGVDTNAANTRASYFGSCVKISLIVQKALSKLYSPQASVDSWKQVQKEIEALSTELDAWLAALPAEFEPTNAFYESNGQRERLMLSFHYHSAKLLIHRPCLCRLERRIIGQSDASAQFNQKAAQACIEAAQAVTRLLPEQPDIGFVYQESPWWCIVHNIMQAMAVFLLEISFSQTHMTHSDNSILASTRKLVRWLQFMSTSNAIAQRAYRMIVEVLRAGASRLQVDISDIVAEGEACQGHALPHSKEPPLGHKDGFLHDDWELPSFDDPATAAGYGTQNPNAWQQQPGQDLRGFQPDQYFMPDPQMPSMFGNPFFTSFDLSNPLEEGFYEYDVNDA